MTERVKWKSSQILQFRAHFCRNCKWLFFPHFEGSRRHILTRDTDCVQVYNLWTIKNKTWKRKSMKMSNVDWNAIGTLMMGDGLCLRMQIYSCISASTSRPWIRCCCNCKKKPFFMGEDQGFLLWTPHENHIHPNVKISLGATWMLELFNRANLWWVQWKEL